MFRMKSLLAFLLGFYLGALFVSLAARENGQ